MPANDHYATLGVPRDAAPDAIRQAYRRLARKYHPDVSSEPAAEERFKEVGEAWKVLGDADRRSDYDAWLRRRERAASGGFDPFVAADGDDLAGLSPDDLFDTLFGRAGQGGGRGAGARGRRRRAGRGGRGEDLHATLEIDLRDAYLGARRTLTLRVPEPLPGGGFQMSERQLEIEIPQGVQAGTRLRLAGQGGPGEAGGPSGDLYLELVFAPDPRFEVDGRDVTVRLPVAPWEAALGARVEVPTPDGRVEVSVPAGSASGRRLRLRGRGLPGAEAGDLYVVLVIVSPPADSPTAQQAWRTLAGAFPGFDPRRAPAAAR